MATTLGRAAAALTLLAGLAGAAPLAGQSPAHAPRSGGRSLGGHTFLPLSTVPLPFVGTAFTSTVGAAIAHDVAEAVIVDVGGVLDTLLGSGNLAFAAIDLVFQQRIKTRFAVRGAASINVRTGTNGRTLVAEGLSGLTGFAIGGLMRLHEDERRLLTATLDLRRGNLNELSIKDFAEYAAQWGIDSLEHWGEHLMQSHRSGRILAGLRGAWVPKAWLGLSALIEGGPADLYERGGDVSLRLGVAGSLDFNRFDKAVPIGIGLGLGTTTSPVRADDIFGSASTVNLGVYYTGRPDLAVGLDTQWSSTKLVAANDHVLTSVFRFVMRYDF